MWLSSQRVQRLGTVVTSAFPGAPKRTGAIQQRQQITDDAFGCGGDMAASSVALWLSTK